MPEPLVPAQPTKPTLRQEFIVIGATMALMVLAFAFEPAAFPDAYAEDRMTPLSLVGNLVVAAGHGLWITMDRKRRGLKVGAWRWFALLTGPVAISVYLFAEYGLRGFLLVLAYISIFALAFTLVVAGSEFGASLAS